MRNKLYRDEQHKKIGGVCAGLAEYFDVDTSLVRVLFVLALVVGGGGFLGYIILWIVVPNKPLISPSDEFFASSQPQAQRYPNAPFAPVNKPVTTGSIVGGIILILLGVYLTLNQYDIVHLDFNTFWPIVLIIIGLILMFGFWQKGTSGKQTNSWDDKNSNNTDSSQII